MVNHKLTLRLTALLPAIAFACFGCGGASTPTPLDGAYPFYNTAWTGTFSEVSVSSTGTLSLNVSGNGGVTGIWQDYQGLVYTLSGVAGHQGSIKGNFTNSGGGTNGTFSGGITTAGSGTNIASATATGTITLYFGSTFSVYDVSLSYSGAP
jgi:hypothetical protein